MAGRFVFQKLASGMPRSASRLGAQASASSRVTAAACRATTAPFMPRASEDGIRTLSRFFHNVAVRPGNNVVPSISNHGSIRGYSRVPAKVRRLKAKMSPSINNYNNSSALVDSVGQVKPTCSPDASNQLKQAKVPWYNRPVDLKFIACGFCAGYAGGAIVFSKDANNSSSMVPSPVLRKKALDPSADFFTMLLVLLLFIQAIM